MVVPKRDATLIQIGATTLGLVLLLVWIEGGFEPKTPPGLSAAVAAERPAPGTTVRVERRDADTLFNWPGTVAALTVTQVESEIVVEETPGQRRELYPNGRTYKTDEGATQIRTSWKDGKLVVERKNVRGWRLVETWELAPDRGRLVIHLLLEGGARPKLNLTRVYDRYDAESPG